MRSDINIKSLLNLESFFWNENKDKVYAKKENHFEFNSDFNHNFERDDFENSFSNYIQIIEYLKSNNYDLNSNKLIGKYYKRLVSKTDAFNTKEKAILNDVNLVVDNYRHYYYSNLKIFQNLKLEFEVDSFIVYQGDKENTLDIRVSDLVFVNVYENCLIQIKLTSNRLINITVLKKDFEKLVYFLHLYFEF